MRIGIQEAIQRIRDGEVVAIPTETVYGLAASIHCSEAIDRIYTLKGRPAKNPLIIHASSFEEVCLLAQGSLKEGAALAEAFWPGAMTLVLPAAPNIPEKVRAGLPTAAFRIPEHPLTLNLLRAIGPLAAPSANMSGRPSSTAPSHVETDFGADFPVLDGGVCTRGLESTILGMHEGEWKILRLGSIPPEAFKSVLGYIPEVGNQVLCPGQLYRHYAPQAHLVLSEEYVPCEAIVGYSNRHYPERHPLFSLGHSDNPIAVSQSLYDTLRQLDQRNISSAWVDMRIPKSGLWLTIAERLQKAAAS